MEGQRGSRLGRINLSDTLTRRAEIPRMPSRLTQGETLCPKKLRSKRRAERAGKLRRRPASSHTTGYGTFAAANTGKVSAAGDRDRPVQGARVALSPPRSGKAKEQTRRSAKPMRRGSTSARLGRQPRVSRAVSRVLERQPPPRPAARCRARLSALPLAAPNRFAHQYAQRERRAKLPATNTARQLCAIRFSWLGAEPPSRREILS
jgi:hypothetical protein